MILTKNEESNIRRCLGSVAWSDDIVVYDSESTDRTTEISRGLGARVVTRKFDNWSAHQNWAVGNIDFKHPWVLYIDADEQCDDELRQEVTQRAVASAQESAFRVRRKDYFMGRWLRRSQLYPTWIVRVFRPDRIRYERLVNPVAVVDGGTGELQGHLLHHPFSHGVSHWFDRHNRYSSFEAEDLLEEIQSSVDWSGLICRDASRRRKAMKHLAYRLPGRPGLMFLYLYVARLGFLDGAPGYYYSRMRAAYELMIDVKVRELRWRQSSSESVDGPIRQVVEG
ncbi:glycosyltransferase family 2 protein [Posidoniimonas corsicana]|uniref:glycosyltransferase family 2 protein n=1 Tax=Posidoniimonas corsicana TaxID=1938618 RepID=UPI0018D3D5E8|nr:glycosyltransferase family 2 protein [Posidoniimonas corsicana]